MTSSGSYPQTRSNSYPNTYGNQESAIAADCNDLTNTLGVIAVSGPFPLIWRTQLLSGGTLYRLTIREIVFGQEVKIDLLNALNVPEIRLTLAEARQAIADIGFVDVAELTAAAPTPASEHDAVDVIYDTEGEWSADQIAGQSVCAVTFDDLTIDLLVDTWVVEADEVQPQFDDISISLAVDEWLVQVDAPAIAFGDIVYAFSIDQWTVDVGVANAFFEDIVISLGVDAWAGGHDFTDQVFRSRVSERRGFHSRQRRIAQYTSQSSIAAAYGSTIQEKPL